MSVETLALAALVEEGRVALRKLYANGVNQDDFPVYAEEFEWIEQRLSVRKPVNRRLFRQRFPDFEWIGVPKEPIEDLAHSLREERVLSELTTVMTTLSQDLRPDNAIELANLTREKMNEITRAVNVNSDTLIEDWRSDIKETKARIRANKVKGTTSYLKTGFVHLDHHLGGLMPGQFIEFLGRTGEGKSLKVYAIALNAKMQNATVGIFTPELSRHEVKCRIHTLASARPEVQKALGLERSFRNRALMFDRGYNVKSYERFCQYFDEELPGRMWLLSGTHRQEQMTVGYIEDRIVSLGLDLVIVDPIYLLKPVRMHRDNQYQEIAWTAEALHRLTEQYNIPIIFTNQSHLEGGAKDDAPAKERSFGAKALAHLSDYIIGVKHVSEENRMICRCTKSRFGQSSFRYEIGLYANTGVIKELTPLHGSYYNGNDDETEEDAIREVIKSVSDDDD